MTSRDRERTGSLFGEQTHAPPPEPVPASNIVEPSPGELAYASESCRPDCPACEGSGFVPGEELEPLDCPRCVKPKLNMACEDLRRRTGLWISAKDVGDCPAGVLWVWEVITPGGERLPVAIEHDRSTDKELLVYLTGVLHGQSFVPF